MKKDLIIYSIFIVIIIFLGVFIYFSLSKKVVISFDSNGGSFVKPIEVKRNSKVDLPRNIKKTGYKFVGWYDDDKLLSNTIIARKNKTLTAKWDKEYEEETINYKCPEGYDLAGSKCIKEEIYLAEKEYLKCKKGFKEDTINHECYSEIVFTEKDLECDSYKGHKDGIIKGNYCYYGEYQVNENNSCNNSNHFLIDNMCYKYMVELEKVGVYNCLGKIQKGNLCEIRVSQKIKYHCLSDYTLIEDHCIKKTIIDAKSK